jgi:hypothetical protein
VAGPDAPRGARPRVRHDARPDRGLRQLGRRLELDGGRRDPRFQSEASGRGTSTPFPSRGGAPREIFHGGTAAGARVTRDGRVVFATSALSRPTDIAVVGLDGKECAP